MENVVLTIHLILALLLIGVVLLQGSECGGLCMGGVGGGAVSARRVAPALGKITWALAAAFICTSLTLTIVAAGEGKTGSVADQIGIEAPKAAEPELPAASDLLPPAPADAPATPQKAED